MRSEGNVKPLYSKSKLKQMNKSQLLKLVHKINKFYIVFNKYIYILPLFSLLNNFSSFRNNKLFKSISVLLRIVTYFSFIFGFAVFVYFTDFTTPLNNTFSLYSDLLEPYIELIKHLFHKLLNYFKTLIDYSDSSSQIKNEMESVLRDTKSQIKNEVKTGMKEAINEALNNMPQDESNLLKQIALIGSGVFFIYFFFILPGPTIDPEVLNSYNWINQSLIEFKNILFDLFTKPTNPGNPGAPGVIETINSSSTDGLRTITPNSPVISNRVLLRSIGVQTNLDGVGVSKMVETVNIIKEAFDTAESETIRV